LRRKKKKTKSGAQADIGDIEKDMNQVSLVDGKTVSTFEEKKDLTLPAREKPEKSVRLMREQGMLRKY